MTYNYGLHRTAASLIEGRSVIAHIANKVPAMNAWWAAVNPDVRRQQTMATFLRTTVVLLGSEANSTQCGCRVLGNDA